MIIPMTEDWFLDELERFQVLQMAPWHRWLINRERARRGAPPIPSALARRRAARAADRANGR